MRFIFSLIEKSFGWKNFFLDNNNFNVNNNINSIFEITQNNNPSQNNSQQNNNPQNNTSQNNNPQNNISQNNNPQNNSTKTKNNISKQILKYRLTKIGHLILKQYKYFAHTNIYVSLLLTDANEMHELNRKFRNKDKPTDVLSFQDTIINPSHLHQEKFQRTNEQHQLLQNKNIYLGDIAFSCEMLNKYCIENNIKFNDHFYFMFVHSFLHLLGFDHETDHDAIQMDIEQTKIMHIIYKEH